MGVEGGRSRGLGVCVVWLLVLGLGCSSVLGIDKPGSATPDAASSSLTVDRSGGVVADGVDEVVVSIVVRDALGNPVSGRSVALAVEPPEAASFASVSLLTDSAGLATTTLSSTRAGSKQVTATVDGEIVIPERPTIEFVAGPAARLALAVPPGNAIAGEAIAPAVQVRIEDAQGNAVDDGDDAITMNLGTNPSAGTLSGTLVVTAVDGIASFSDLAIDKPGAGYTLTASATDRAEVTSAGFEITIGPGARLVFLNHPTTTVAGSSITPEIQVAIEDQAGNRIVDATDEVSIAIGANAGTAVLSGTLSVSALAGVASFSDLSINQAAAGYTLVVTATGYAGNEGAPFTVSPGAPSDTTSTVVAEPAADVLADGVAIFTVTVTVRDALGNGVPGAVVTLDGSPASGNSLTPVGGVTSDAAGLASWTLASTKAEVKTLKATVDGSLVLSQEPTVAFVAGPVSASVSMVTVAPSTVVANGVAAATVTVTARDAQANPVSGQTVVVAISGSANSFAQPAATDGSGVSSTSLSSTKAEGKTVAVTIGGLSISQEPTVTFVPGPVASAVSSVAVSPAVVVADGTTKATVTVTVRDAFGNPLAGEDVLLNANPALGAIVVQPAGLTSATGVITGTLAATVAEIKVVTATVDPAGTPVVLSEAPEVAFTAVPPEIVSSSVDGSGGCVPITFAVRQAEALRADISVEYDDGSGFKRATQAGSSSNDGVTAVSSSSAAAGQTHTFLWNSTADLRHRTASPVTLRLTASVAGVTGVPRDTVGATITNGATWAAHADTAVGAEPRGMASADLDGDGIVDLVTANAAGTVSVLLGNGSGGLGAASNLTGLSSPYGVAIADLDHDGSLDLVVSNEGFNDVGVYLGDGSGGFSGVAKYTAGGIPYGLTIADFNRDGDLDLAVADAGASAIRLLLGDGSGGFGTATAVSSGSSPRSVVAIDVDRDGAIDLVSANYSANSVSVMLGNGDGSFQAPANTALSASPMSLSAGDFNGDGWPDLAVARDGSAAVAILRNDGGGALLAPTVYLATGSSPKAVAVKDVDGDGQDDVVTANSGGASASVFVGNGNATFQLAQTVTAGSSPLAVLAVDLDRDGLLDLVTANHGSDDVSVLINTKVAACERSFAAARLSSAGSEPRTVAVGDFDGDGKPDAVTANADSASLTVVLGSGNGRYHSPVTLAAGTLPTTVVTADFDLDGHLDLANTNLDSGNVSIRLGNGDGSFQGEVQRATGSGAYGLVAVDLDGDGAPELVASNLNDGTLSVLENDGAGAFAAAVDVAVPSSPGELAVGFLDADDQPDVVVATQSGATVLLGNGAGGLGTPASFSSSGSLRGVAVGLVDGDDAMDLVGVNAEGTVAILLGAGNGTFGSAATYATADNPLAVALGDFDGDGVLDVASVSDSPVSGVSVLRGVGDGSLELVITYLVANGAYGLKTADLDGDGRLDVIATARSSGAVAVLLGNGDATFEGAVATATGVAPAALASADFNRDGNLDVAVAVLGAAELAVHLGDGVGGFGAATLVAVANPANHLVAGDFDGDGVADLATASVGGSNVSVVLGAGDGSFGAPASRAVTSIPRSLAVGDLDRDGVLDLVTGHSFAVDVLLGNGDGTMQAAVSSVVPCCSSGALVGDFDRDGALDVAVVGISAGTSVGFLRGNGSASLAASVTSAVVANVATNALRVADLNRDGQLDLTGDVYVPGNGDGTFGVGTALGFGRGLVAVQDVDSDGLLDVVANDLFGLLQVGRGNGDGTFQAPQSYGIGGAVDALLAGAVTRDGRVDLVIANQARSLMGAVRGR